jgi:hypothetical protein
MTGEAQAMRLQLAKLKKQFGDPPDTVVIPLTAAVDHFLSR